MRGTSRHKQGQVPRRRGFARRWALAVALLVAALVAVPVALAAGGSHPAPGQRIDLKVLVLASTTADAASWQVALQREGVPYDVIATGAAGPITDATLADYGANRARYQAVIAINPDGLGLDAGESAALAKFESTFSIRQFSDNTYPNAARGFNAPATADDLAGDATLTAAGKALFPYLKGDVPIAAGAYRYRATPLAGANLQSLLTEQSGGQTATLLGLNTRADGTQELVFTGSGNQYQSHNQLLRHGIVNWVTRGVYLGTQRNYLELQVDDTFLADDIWNPATHTTDYDPANAVRMNAADVAAAVTWSAQRGVRIDQVFNGGGSVAFTAANGSDPLLAAFQANKSAFGWINHTFEHPNLDCTTAAYTAKQITDNVTWAGANGFSIDPGELVTGEHSGLANTRPGNPGTIDPPELEDVTPGGAGTVPAGTYTYGVTATTAAGETVASTSQTTLAAPGAVTVRWDAICGATGYKVYRVTGTGSTLLTTVGQPSPAFDDAGAVKLSYTDNGSAGSAGTPPTANSAVKAPYPQNPALIAALTSAGVKVLAGDASKDYPDPAGTATTFPAGTAFADGPATVIPRYPTNVYYNTATQEQQLDEYNWLYTAPSGGGACVDVPGVTTCNATPVTWAQYVDSEVSIMLGHVQGNDPRPHYFHQTNLAQTASPNGGVFYPVIDGLLTRYRALYEDNAPLVQLQHTEIAQALAQQAAWRAAQGSVTAYLLDGQVHLTSASTVSVPVTGTTAGAMYGGQRSGWTTVPGGTEVVLEPNDPANANAPVISGNAAPGATLSASTGTWTGTTPIDYGYQWQRCDAAGDGCAVIAGADAATYAIAPADLGKRLRVVVLAGNAISSVSQARSAATAAVAVPTTPTTPTTPSTGGGGGGGASGGSAGGGATKGSAPTTTTAPSEQAPEAPAPEPTRPAITPAPARGALTVTAVRVRRGTVSWKLNAAAGVTVTVDKVVTGRRVLGTCRATTRSTRNRPTCRRSVKAGSVVRTARSGAGSVDLTSSVRLGPGRYRVTVSAVAADGRRAVGRAATLVVKGA